MTCKMVVRTANRLEGVWWLGTTDLEKDDADYGVTGRSMCSVPTDSQNHGADSEVTEPPPLPNPPNPQKHAAQSSSEPSPQRCLNHPNTPKGLSNQRMVGQAFFTCFLKQWQITKCSSLVIIEISDPLLSGEFGKVAH